jgi:hypothetical protein
MGECERCGARIPSDSFELMDFCAKCSKNLCDACMKKGCCGKVPAASGSEIDYWEPPDEDEADC